jgi:two-component system phosphate regulon sensor histidine kinase PhoR
LSVRSQLKAIEASQSETQGILASMSNGVIALDNEHRIITMNPAATRMFGVLGRDIRGRLLEEVVRDPSFLQAISEGVDEGRMLFKELELESLGGRTMEVAIEPLFGGRLLQMTGVLIVLNETTRLRRLERIRSDFAANVSHELRTPLTAVRGYIELLEQNVTDEEGVKRLKIVDRNAARLGAIIEDLLTLSRLESDDESSMPLDFEPLDAEDLLNGVAAVCLEQAQRGGVEVRVESERTQFEGNRHLLDQALVNLVENAIRYGGDGSVVTLRGRATNVNEVELAVSDTGPGIAPEHLSRLFERFYRVDSGRSREQGGTGLGLSIVKHIALVHGGQVGVESQVGSSSTFFIRLPVAGPAR